ncbi:MAG: deoxyribonuclease IV [Eggerthellaceae bacterium]|nr:deoxyribonuclease IV [Eggerthellaceae bacterium]
MLTIGCHLSKREGYLFMAKEAASIDANTFQYFTRNPRGGAQAELDQKDVEAYRAFAKEHGITQVCGYAPYDVEPANPDIQKKDFTLMVMSEDLARLEEIPNQYYLVRPGSAPDVSADEAIQNVSDALNKTLHATQSTIVLLDTMPGEGHQVGYTFDQLAKMIDGVKLKDKVGICMDTAAVWAAGYDIKSDLDGVLDEFDAKIGLDKLYCLHLNDSKEELGSRVDRHAPVGEGNIGFDALSAITNSPRLAGRAFYLEEPHSTLVIYERDVARFRKAYTGK